MVQSVLPPVVRPHMVQAQLFDGQVAVSTDFGGIHARHGAQFFFSQGSASFTQNMNSMHLKTKVLDSTRSTQ